MSPDIRKTFIQNNLAQLIEKSVDGKIIKAITKTMDEWLKVFNNINIKESYVKLM